MVDHEARPFVLRRRQSAAHNDTAIYIFYTCNSLHYDLAVSIGIHASLVLWYTLAYVLAHA